MPVASGFDQALYLQRTLSEPGRLGLSVEDLRAKLKALQAHAVRESGVGLECDLARRALAANGE
ncbi:MAG: hypothetical protein ACKVUT_11820 [Gaiella sp.]